MTGASTCSTESDPALAFMAARRSDRGADRGLEEEEREDERGRREGEGRDSASKDESIERERRVRMD